MLQNKLQLQSCYFSTILNIIPFHNPQLRPTVSCQVHSALQCLCSVILLRAEIFWSLYKEKWRFPNIRGLFCLYIKRLENWWLSVLEISLSGNSPHVPPHFLLRFFVFHIVFLLFFFKFSLFPVVFLPAFYFSSYSFKHSWENLLFTEMFWSKLKT